MDVAAIRLFFQLLHPARRREYLRKHETEYYLWVAETKTHMENYPRYLPKAYKQKLLDKLTASYAQIPRLPWFWQRLTAPMTQNITEMESFIQQYNETYIQRELGRYGTFFSGEEFGHGMILNEDQKRAIIINDRHNLTIAGPGAGKTRMLTDRIAYFILKKQIPAYEMLVLAYNKSAAQEIVTRLQQRYGINDVRVATFHSLGLQIIRKYHAEKIKVIEQKGKVIDNLLNTLIQSNSPFRRQVLDYYTLYRDDDRVYSESVANEQELVLQENKEYETLDGILVKSIAERDIANFFIRHNITYVYEGKVDWCDTDSLSPSTDAIEEGESKSLLREYHPDFFLPDHEIYIEHWAIGETGVAPPWFVGGTEKYRADQAWKRIQFQKHHKILWETDYELWRKGRLETKLRELCINQGISLVPLDEATLISNFIGRKKGGLSELVENAISAAKLYGYSPPQLHEKITNTQKLKIRELKFFELVGEIFEKYQTYLNTNGLIDFEDMINLAVTDLSQNLPELGASTLFPFQMIMVDEFQDISRQRVNLVKLLLQHNPKAALLCVGDDWQAIYGFAGSSSRFMVDFSYFFPDTIQTLLRYNYRNPPLLLELGAQLIATTAQKIDKNLVPKQRQPKGVPERPDWQTNKHEIWHQHRGHPPETLIFSPYPIAMLSIRSGYWNDFLSQQVQTVIHIITELLAHNVPPEEIMVLSRFNFGYAAILDFCRDHPDMLPERIKGGDVIRTGIRFYSVHKSKGLEAKYVILLNMNEGIYGFPPKRKDPSNLALISEDLSDRDDEERRLLYVAITRTAQKLFMITWQGHESTFYLEIEHSLQDLLKIPSGIPNPSTQVREITELTPEVWKIIEKKEAELLQNQIMVACIIRQTEKALLVKFNLTNEYDATMWVPKSAIETQSERNAGLYNVTLRNWWLRKKITDLTADDPPFKIYQRE